MTNWAKTHQILPVELWYILWTNSKWPMVFDLLRFDLTFDLEVKVK